MKEQIEQPAQTIESTVPRHSSVELLHAYLQEHDAPCPLCGYNLRGVTLLSCPECDAPIELCVGSSQLQLGAWLFAMLSFAMALGFDLVIAMLIVVPIIMTRGEDGAILFLGAALVTLGLGSAGMLWVLIAKKRVWLGMPRRRQWKSARMIFAGVFLLHLLTGVGVFLIAI